MRIVTHNGKMHADEVASVALLTSYFGNKGEEISLLRTRDDKIFQDGDIIVDVGSEYDHSKLKYDHHQNYYEETWANGDDIPLATLGLIWRHYGQKIVEMYLSNLEGYDYTYSEETIKELMDIIYYEIFQEIDANDNGIMSENENNLNIPEIVAALNCPDVFDEETQNNNFNRAVALVGNIFDIKFREIINSYFNYQKDLEVVNTFNLTEPYLVIENNIPTIFKCLDELDPERNVKFCIFHNKEKDEYSVKTRTIRKFTPVCYILSEELLRTICKNPDDIIFVHKAGFLAKSKTLETAKDIINNSLISLISVPLNDSIEEEQAEQPKKSSRLLSGVALGSVAALSVAGYLYFRNND